MVCLFGIRLRNTITLHWRSTCRVSRVHGVHGGFGVIGEGALEYLGDEVVSEEYLEVISVWRIRERVEYLAFSRR